MNNLFFSFIVTSIAGFSTLLGCLIVLFKDNNKKKIISYSLMFSSSIMLYISILDLIPNGYNYISKIYNPIVSMLIISIFILGGFFFTRFIDNFLIKNDNNLYKVGIISMLALIIHNIPEGIITFLTTTKDIKIGLSLSISIALHNIPEGISIFVPIYYSTNSKLKAFLYTFIAGFSEVMGAILSYLFLYKYANNYFFAFIFSLTAGIMIYISCIELIPESIKTNKRKLYIPFILGIIVMILSEAI